jgi:hypothetical protein
MIPPEKLILFIVSSLALLVVPGPAVLYIVTRSLSQGRTAGLASMAGVNAGALTHTLAAALGLSAILVSSALAFSVVKYAGAAYLIYLGVRQFFTKGALEDVQYGHESLWRIFSQGYLTGKSNAANAELGLAVCRTGRHQRWFVRLALEQHVCLVETKSPIRLASEVRDWQRVCGIGSHGGNDWFKSQVTDFKVWARHPCKHATKLGLRDRLEKLLVLEF